MEIPLVAKDYVYNKFKNLHYTIKYKTGNLAKLLNRKLIYKNQLAIYESTTNI